MMVSISCLLFKWATYRNDDTNENKSVLQVLALLLACYGFEQDYHIRHNHHLNYLSICSWFSSILFYGDDIFDAGTEKTILMCSIYLILIWLFSLRGFCCWWSWNSWIIMRFIIKVLSSRLLLKVVCWWFWLFWSFGVFWCNRWWSIMFLLLNLQIFSIINFVIIINMRHLSLALWNC